MPDHVEGVDELLDPFPSKQNTFLYVLKTIKQFHLMGAFLPTQNCGVVPRDRETFDVAKVL